MKRAELKSVEEDLCIPGCNIFSGHERRHHKHCPYYPESFSKRYDNLEAELKELKKEGEKPFNPELIPGFVEYDDAGRLVKWIDDKFNKGWLFGNYSKDLWFIQRFENLPAADKVYVDQKINIKIPSHKFGIDLLKSMGIIE
jgi:hypothetical protein